MIDVDWNEGIPNVCWSFSQGIQHLILYGTDADIHTIVWAHYKSLNWMNCGNRIHSTLSLGVSQLFSNTIDLHGVDFSIITHVTHTWTFYLWQCRNRDDNAHIVEFQSNIKIEKISIKSLLQNNPMVH